jgi:hypothetical protein
MGRKIPDADLDWLTIEARFRAGESARSIGQEVGIPHSRIMRRAERFGWIRNPVELKRERVKAALLGDPGTAAAETLLETSAQRDAEDMALGLANARAILRKIADQLEKGIPMIRVVTTTDKDEDGTKTTREEVVTSRVEPGPLQLKTLGAANLTAVEAVRRIEELDGPDSTGFYTKEERDAIVDAAIGPEA